MLTFGNNPYLALTLFQASESALLKELDSVQALTEARGDAARRREGVLSKTDRFLVGLVLGIKERLRLAPSHLPRLGETSSAPSAL